MSHSTCGHFSDKIRGGRPEQVAIQHASAKEVQLKWGFRREVDENWGRPGYYAASSRNSLPTFRGNLSVPFSTDPSRWDR